MRVSCFEGEQELGSSLGEAADAEQAEDRARERLMDRLLKAEASPAQKPPAERPIKRQEMVDAKQLREQQAAGKNEQSKSEPSPSAPPLDQASQPKAISAQITEAIAEPSEEPTDPDDWSEELTAIDLQLKRIGWTREHEQMYLERAYGHGSRHKLTKYSDLVSFLNRLKSFEISSFFLGVPSGFELSQIISPS